MTLLDRDLPIRAVVEPAEAPLARRNRITACICTQNPRLDILSLVLRSMSEGSPPLHVWRYRCYILGYNGEETEHVPAVPVQDRLQIWYRCPDQRCAFKGQRMARCTYGGKELEATILGINRTAGA